MSISDSQTRNAGLGIALIVATCLTISIQDLVFKLFSGDLTLWQIFTLRGMMTLPVLILIARMRGISGLVVRDAFGFWPLLRAGSITLTFLAFYGALPFLSLSTVGAANYIAPVFVALLSAFVIREPVGRLGWIGVVLGFGGVVVLLQPGSDAFSWFALLPVAGAGFYAIAHIITRTRCQDISVEALAFAQNGMMLTAGLIVSTLLFAITPQGAAPATYPYLLGPWSAVGLSDWMVLGVLAIFAVSIGMMLSGAYKSAPPAKIATFEYSYLVFVAVWDILFFGTALTPASLAGMVMIIAAGLLVIARKR